MPGMCRAPLENAMAIDSFSKLLTARQGGGGHRAGWMDLAWAWMP